MLRTFGFKRNPVGTKMFMWAVVMSVVWLLGLNSCTSNALVLAIGGETGYSIVVPAEADVSTRAVAGDFANILELITGATFSVITDLQPITDREIVIGGTNSRLLSLGLKNVTQGFVQGEYEIRTVGRCLVIAGGPPRGTINGMYGFLQDHLGCRWFTPGVSQIPKKGTLRLGNIYDRQKPSFRWRAVCSSSHWDGAWTARTRQNECKTYGGGDSVKVLMSDPRVKSIGNYCNAHALTHIPASLYEEHPEYYAMIDGERLLFPNKGVRAYCVTNDGFVGYMADLLKEQLRNSPDIRFVSIGHGDTSNYCQCETCKASYARLGLGGTYMEFNNKVAEGVTKDFPGVTIVTIAYGITFKPPSFNLHPNIRLIWCPLGTCTIHALDECQPNCDRDWTGLLDEWLERTSQLGVWYYHYQVDCLMPHANLLATKKDLTHFQEVGVDDVFVQYNVGATIRSNPVPDGDKLLPAYGDAENFGYFTVPWGLEHLKAYIATQLLWDTDFNVENGIREFCETYYGPAANEMTRFALLVESVDSYDRTISSKFERYGGVHQYNFAIPLKWSVVQEMTVLFDQAETKVAGNPILRRRIQMAKLSLQMEILWWFTPTDGPLWQEAFNSFLPFVEELGMGKKALCGAGMEGWTPVEQFKVLMEERAVK